MRTVAQDGKITLIVQFTDGNYNPIDPDGAVTVDIFDPDFPPFNPDVTDGDATVLGATPTKIAGEVGLYEYEYTLAPDSKVGFWYDRWRGDVDSVAQEEIHTFEVTEKMSIQSVALSKNQVVVIKLDDSITNTNGETLSDNAEIFFSTVLDPMCASAELVGLEVGVYIPNIPDFTLDLNIHWASLEAQACTFKRKIVSHPITGVPMRSGSTVNQDWLNWVKTEFTVCRAAGRLLNNAIAYPVKSKTLADLSVSYDTSKMMTRLDEMKKRCAELKRILNSGGQLSEGASLPVSSTVKGARDVDRPMFGRSWSRGHFVRGGANVKTQPAGSRRGYRHWSSDPTFFKPWWSE